MAAALKDIGAVAVGGGATVATSYPASAAVGDLAMLLCLSGNGATPAAPTGFTTITFASVGSGGTDVGALRIYAYYRTLDGSEGATVNAPRASGTQIQAAILLFTGHDTTTPVTSSTAKNQTPAATTASTNTIATKASDGIDYFLAFYGHDRDANTASVRTNSVFANISATVSSVLNDFSTQSGGGGFVVEGGAPTGDSTGSVSHSMDITSSIWASLLFRINAGAGGTDASGAGGPGTVTSSAAGGLGAGAANGAAGPGTVTSSAAGGLGAGAANGAAGPGTATVAAASGVGAGNGSGAAGTASASSAAASGLGSGAGSGTGGLAANDAEAPQGTGASEQAGSGTGSPGVASAGAATGSGSGDGLGSGSSNVVQIFPPSGVGSVQVPSVPPESRTTRSDAQLRLSAADVPVRTTQADRRAA